jgi:hypothetical protein
MKIAVGKRAQAGQVSSLLRIDTDAWADDGSARSRIQCGTTDRVVRTGLRTVASTTSRKSVLRAVISH